MPLIKDITPKELVKGFAGHYAHGKDLTLGYIEIQAGHQLPQHDHIHEQITYIIEGQLDMVIGSEQVSLTAGSFYVIPSGVSHGAFAATDCKVIDVFNPVREDYKFIE